MQQTDGPPGDIDEVEIIDVSSDSSSDVDFDNLGVVPESPQSADIEDLVSESHSLGGETSPRIPVAVVEHLPSTFNVDADCRQIRLSQTTIQNQSTTSAGRILALTPALKLPSRSEMGEWLADPSNKGSTKRLSSDTQRQNDIDAIDLEEIQARLSADESMAMSDGTGADGGDKHVDATFETPGRIFARSGSSQRHESKDTTILSSQEKRRSTSTNRTIAKRGRRLVWPQPGQPGLASFDVTFASAHDVELIHQSPLPLDVSRRKSAAVALPKRRRMKTFTLRRIRKGGTTFVTPKSKVRKGKFSP